jgi:hypothetical protein
MTDSNKRLKRIDDMAEGDTFDIGGNLVMVKDNINEGGVTAMLVLEVISVNNSQPFLAEGAGNMMFPKGMLIKTED